MWLYKSSQHYPHKDPDPHFYLIEGLPHAAALTRTLWTFFSLAAVKNLEKLIGLWLINVRISDFSPLLTSEFRLQYTQLKMLPGMLMYATYATKKTFQKASRAKCVRTGYYMTLIMVSNHIFNFPVGISTWQLHIAMCQNWILRFDCMLKQLT